MSYMIYLYLFFASQQLVDGTRKLSSNDQDDEIYMELSALFSSIPITFKCARLERCSKKEARKNLKVLASHSADLLCTFADYFLDSSPAKRANLKVHRLLISLYLLNCFAMIIYIFKLQSLSCTCAC